MYFETLCRLVSIVKFCLQYAVEANGVSLDVEHISTVSGVDLRSSDLAPSLDKMLGAKSTFRFPEWLESLKAEMNEIKRAAKISLAVAENIKQELGYGVSNAAGAASKSALKKGISGDEPTEEDSQLLSVRSSAREVIETEIHTLGIR